MPQISGAGVNGAAYLSSALASHLPLDLVVIMLGTNDVKPHLGRTAPRIALGAKRLLDIARTVDGGVGTAYPNPKILLVCPPPLGTLSSQFAEQFAGGHARNALMPALYEAVARAAGVGFLDAGQSIKTDGIDGVHFTAETQRALGHAVAAKVRGMLG
jgi:lysophospholipase L1-like esterase